MKYVIGIDPAARKLAMWVQDPTGGPPKPTFLTLNADDAVAAHQTFRTLCEEIYSMSQKAKDAGLPDPEWVVYQEAPIVQGKGSRIAGSLSQALVAGGYMAAAGEFSAEHRRVHPGTWKSKVVGNGNADKGKIQEHVADVWPDDWRHCFTSRGLVIEDLADARCILEYGIQNNRIMEAMRKKRKKK